MTDGPTVGASAPIMTVLAEDGSVFQRTLVGTSRVETEFTPAQARALASMLRKAARMAEADA